MARVQDVAAYIITKQGAITTLKLQKLVYYSQSWHLVWHECALFDSPIEAWANGPVTPVLYREHRGLFKVDRAEQVGGTPDALQPADVSTVDAVLGFYGDKTGQWLSDLTHREDPWKRTRAGDNLRAGERSSTEIGLDKMHEYYSSLL